MTNYLSRETCERLNALVPGVETEKWWKSLKYDDGFVWYGVMTGKRSVGFYKSIAPAYQLTDLLRNLEKIGDVLGWKIEVDYMDEENVYYQGDDTSIHAHRILEAFLKKDMAGVEEYLAGILKGDRPNQTTP